MSSTSSFKITGMDCMGCVKSITRSIKGLSPDADVQVELESGKVTVTGPLTEAQMQEAATMSGFGYGGRI